MRNLTIICLCLISIILFNACQKPNNEVEYQADIIVYGGTSAGIIAAVQAKKMGKTVLVVSPDVHLGGLSSGGLGFTDTGDKSVIGGLAREFYHRIYLHYQREESWKWQAKADYGNVGQGTPAIDGDARTMWIFEPHAAEQVFEDFVREYDIQVLRNEWLDRGTALAKQEGRIVSLKTLSGKTIRGKVFIDASYEGDLMAAAGVGYHIGRESNSVYGEKWNGVQFGVFQHGHYFRDSISPYLVPGDPTSGLLPEISGEAVAENGSGDSKIQAYNFRMCLSKHPDNRVPFPKPENYDPARYGLLARVYAAGWGETFDKYDPIPNLKTDTNNHGPFSTDYIGKNYAYPEASYKERRSIIKEHEDYQKGLLYFLANDPSVPEAVQARINEYGLAKDEFANNGHWPHQIYVREARRMLGDYVMTEHDVLGDKKVPRSVGMGSYHLDSHNAQRIVGPNGYVQNEGDIGVKPKEPYGISYGTIIPKKSDCTNLFVPVCVSSSHTAFGSIRMEPVFMILGQSAATAAAFSIDQNIAVQDLPFGILEERLKLDGQVLELGEALK